MLLKLLHQRVEQGARLLFGVQPKVVEVAVDHHVRNAEALRQATVHPVPAVRVVGAGLGVVVDDAVDVVVHGHRLHVAFLVILGADDEEFGVRTGHAFERIIVGEVLEDPAVAVGGGDNACPVGCKLLRIRP